MISLEEIELVERIALKELHKSIKIIPIKDSDDFTIIRTKTETPIDFKNDIYKWVDKQLQNIRANQVYYYRYFNNSKIFNDAGIKIGNIIKGQIKSIDALKTIHASLLDLPTNFNPELIDVQIEENQQCKTDDYNIGNEMYLYVLSYSFIGTTFIVYCSRTHYGLTRELFKISAKNQNVNTEVLFASRIPGIYSMLYVTNYTENLDLNEISKLDPYISEENIIVIKRELGMDIIQDIFHQLGYKIIDARYDLNREFKSQKYPKLKINILLKDDDYYELLKNTNLLRLIRLLTRCRICLEKESKTSKLEHDFDMEGSKISYIDPNDPDNFINVSLDLYFKLLTDKLVINNIKTLFQFYFAEEDFDSLLYFTTDDINYFREGIMPVIDECDFKYTCHDCGFTGKLNRLGLCDNCKSRLDAWKDNIK